MKNCLVIMVFVLLSLGAGFSKGAEPHDVIETFEHGFINWTQGLLVSKGVGAPPAQPSGSHENDQVMTLNVSRIHALKNMLSVMLHTRLRANISVGDIAAESEIMMAQIESLAKGAKVVRQEYLSDGTVEITLQLNMFGGFSQLVLPGEIKQIEPIKTVSGAKPSAFGNGADPIPESGTKIFSGLVVDARGTKVLPAMAPAIMDENGKEVYGEAFVSREFAVQKGMSKYVRDIKAAQTDSSVAHNPLTVKGLRSDAIVPSGIFISNADASKIRSASEHLSFLKKCRVIIVMD
jgi:hypothetical protein